MLNVVSIMAASLKYSIFWKNETKFESLNLTKRVRTRILDFRTKQIQNRIQFKSYNLILYVIIIILIKCSKEYDATLIE